MCASEDGLYVRGKLRMCGDMCEDYWDVWQWGWFVCARKTEDGLAVWGSLIVSLFPSPPTLRLSPCLPLPHLMIITALKQYRHLVIIDLLRH